MTSVALKDITDVRDGTHDTPRKLLSGVKLITSRQLKNNQILPTDYFISQEDAMKVDQRSKVDKWDILITMIGTVGDLHLVREDPDYVIKNIGLIKTGGNELLAKYLFYYLQSAEGKSEVRARMSGTSQQFISLTNLRALSINALDEDGMKYVANKLDVYDRLIENNSKRIEKLEAMACLLYRHYFEVPEATDWEELPLSEALLVNRGKSYKGTELSETQGLPFVNLKCVNRGGGFRKDGLKLFTGSFKDTQQVEKGDLVMAVTDMTQERMIVARAARVPSLDGGIGVISMDMVKLEPKEGFVKDYLYAMLRWSRFADEVKNHANGANVLHLLPARISDYSLPMPSQELQEEFASKVSPLFNLIDNLQQKNEALAKARDLLLPRLMSGEITV